MAEDMQRVNPLAHLEKIAGEFERRSPDPPKPVVAAQNEQSYAALGMKMAGVQGAPRVKKPRV